MKCKSEFLLLVNKENYKMFKIEEILQIANKMTQLFLENYSSKGEKSFKNNYGQVIITKDKNDNKNYKLNCFINPSKIKWTKELIKS